MEALVAINWWVGASERDGHQDLHFLHRRVGTFLEKSESFLSTLSLDCLFIFSS